MKPRPPHLPSLAGGGRRSITAITRHQREKGREREEEQHCKGALEARGRSQRGREGVTGGGAAGKTDRKQAGRRRSSTVEEQAEQTVASSGEAASRQTVRKEEDEEEEGVCYLDRMQ